ncbi:MAG: cation:proton antiporter, partial [Candidatus Promineifilaceae bacterium]
MELSSILISLVSMLGATAICVILFEHLGFGSVLGFIVAGIIIGPHTPGFVASQNVNDLQNVAELGVVLFLFTVGLEMLPRKVWAMRRLLFGLGSAQMLATAAILGVYLVFFVKVHWASAIILGFGLAMSSTAIIMTTLQERGALASEHGQTTFAILMAQDLWVVPVMALVPILAHK